MFPIAKPVNVAPLAAPTYFESSPTVNQVESAVKALMLTSRPNESEMVIAVRNMKVSNQSIS
jgi:hypothetical protein